MRSSILRTCLALLGVVALSFVLQKIQRRGAIAEAGGVGTKVKLALNWVPEPEFGGFYAAREGGAYLRQGLDVDIMGGGAGVPVLQMVATGRADFGTVGGDELVTARARGADVVAIFATFQTSPQGIMVHASRKLGNLRDAFHPGTLAIEPGLPYAGVLEEAIRVGRRADRSRTTAASRDFSRIPNFGQQCYVTSEPIAAKMQGSGPAGLSHRRRWLQPVRHRGHHPARARERQARDGERVRRCDR